MTKTLTEQWREGKLPQGWYYMIDCAGKEWFRYLSGVKPDADFVKCFKEVLVPIPNFHDLCELKQELEICKDDKADLYAKLCNALMQLEEANEVIKWYDGLENILIPWEMITGQPNGTAKKYLERYGVK